MKHINIEFNLQDISTFRSALMGIAILWVVFYHFGFQTPGIRHLMRYGYAGVDIFMFLSGFGLYYSLNRNRSLTSYFRKRLIRIYPSYFIVGIAFSLICCPNEGIWDYFWRCSTLGFWTNGVYNEWFIPSILFLYCLFPLAFKLLASNKIKFYVSLIMCCIAIAIYTVFNDDIIDNWHFLLLYRIPIFLFGAITAFYITDIQYYKKYLFIALLGMVMFVGFFVIPGIRSQYISFTFLTPTLIILVCILVKNTTFINKWMEVIGKASLEIYLVHLIFLKYFIMASVMFRENYHDLSTIVFSAISVYIGIVLHKFISKCTHP